MEFQSSVASTMTIIATRPVNMLPVHLSARNRVLRGGLAGGLRSRFSHALNLDQRNEGALSNQAPICKRARLTFRSVVAPRGMRLRPKCARIRARSPELNQKSAGDLAAKRRL